MSPWKLVSIFKKCVFSDAIEVIIKSKAQIKSSRIFLNSLELDLNKYFLQHLNSKPKVLRKIEIELNTTNEDRLIPLNQSWQLFY